MLYNKQFTWKNNQDKNKPESCQAHAVIKS